MTRYQHDDPTIFAARTLIAALISDAPYGNKSQAEDWAHKQAPDAYEISQQQTEVEERLAEIDSLTAEVTS
ncbi:MAG: hypothetical protein AAFX90_10215 [Pseudomonadota bacterium]